MLDISDLVASLRRAGGDTTTVEVKAAAGGLPETMAHSLSALANLPGGGRVILGLDEATGFKPVVLRDPQALKQALGNVARNLTPPVGVTMHDAEVDGQPVIVADVAECPVAQKPCYVTSSAKAYGRSFDGDFELSDLERQALLVARTYQRFDQEPVLDTSRSDLDVELLADWLATVRERDPNGLGRFDNDDDLLQRAGVVARTGELTVAGLLALGAYPQQHLPRQVIQLAASAAPGAKQRASATTTLTGPVPIMLAGALDWARRVFRSTIVSDGSGAVRDSYEYPLDAFRELISNALVHRDLAQWSRGFAIEVRHQSDRLAITNPGGLYGLTVDRLGKEVVSSARNGQLLSICQYVRGRDDGSRVVEALASGIPTVVASLARDGLPPAQFIDTAIRFTVVLRVGTPPKKRPAIKGKSAVAVWEALTAQFQSIADLRAQTHLSSPNLRRILRDLRDEGLVVSEGGPGRPGMRYRRASD
jgi:ATP-dependent DNA helicase RecG